MLRQLSELALWVFSYSVILTTRLLEAVIGKEARLLLWLAEVIVFPTMAHFVSTTTMARIKQLFKNKVEEGEHPGKLYCIPVFQRKDGTTLRVGHLVQRSTKQVFHDDGSKEEEEGVVTRVHVIHGIMITSDLGSATLSLYPVEGSRVIHSEELLCDVADVVAVSGRKVSATVAKNAMAVILNNIKTYPRHIQRTIRKHQLCSTLRREVQKFLSGFSMAKTLNLGAIDWNHDPGILGLERDTDFSLNYHVEKFATSTSHLDVLLGDGWDVRSVGGTDGYRVILTLELWVDLNFDTKVQVHATLCPGALDKNHYRASCLNESSAAVVSNTDTIGNMTMVKTNNKTTNDTTMANVGVSLVWDSFQPPSPTSLLLPGGGTSESNSLEDLIAGISAPGTNTVMGSLEDALCRIPLAADGGPGTAMGNTLDEELPLLQQPGTSTALGSLDGALSRVTLPSHDQMFESPIKEESGAEDDLATARGDSKKSGPNTSTPADELCRVVTELEMTGSTGCMETTPDNSLPLEDGGTTKSLEGSHDDGEVSIKSLEGSPGDGEVSVKSPEGSHDDEETIKSLEGSTKDNVAPEDTSANVEDMDTSNNSNSNKQEPEETTGHDDLDRTYETDQSLDNSHVERTEHIDILQPKSPEKSSVSKVQDYLMNLPTPTRPDGDDTFTDADNNITGGDNIITDGDNNITDVLDKDLTDDDGDRPTPLPHRAVKDDLNASIGSSRSSRLTGLSSQLSGRISSGIFYGQTTVAPVCPFPDDWQYGAIPESIENDDELD